MNNQIWFWWHRYLSYRHGLIHGDPPVPGEPLVIDVRTAESTSRPMSARRSTFPTMKSPTASPFLRAGARCPHRVVLPQRPPFRHRRTDTATNWLQSDRKSGQSERYAARRLSDRLSTMGRNQTRASHRHIQASFARRTV